MKTAGAARSEPDHLLAMAPLAAVVRLAAPTTVVMAVAAVSNIVYTYFVSRLGVEAIGAVSLVFPVSLLAITAMGGGIGAGAASAVARALGAGRRSDAAALAGQALVLSVVIGLGFGLAVQACAAPLFRLMGASGAVHASATLFARVLFGGAAITFLGGMFDSVMRGEGNVRVPAVWSTTSLVLQMACTPLFMFGFGWGLVGAALAMLACQLVATVPRALWVLGGRGLVRPAFRLPRFTLAPVREILRVGVPAALSTSVSNVGLMTLTAVVTRLVVLLGVPGLLLCWRPALWLGLFTDDAGIHAVGAQYFRIIGPSYPFIGVSMVIAFAFQGLGRATIPLAWMIARVVAVLAAAVVCTHGLGLGERAVFTTIATGNVVSAAGLVTLFILTERRLRVATSGAPPLTELAATGTR
ncbi:MAG: hypothetical protein E6J83_14025 [Deltaproteobacteria bacterium]|nr:MAG: hypothetical protein E6J83_14025 [Deltaproteobacteria bacterium]